MKVSRIRDTSTHTGIGARGLPAAPWPQLDHRTIRHTNHLSSFNQSPVRKSQVYKFVDILPYEITNGKQVWIISFILIGSHRKKRLYFTPQICKLGTIGLKTDKDQRQKVYFYNNFRFCAIFESF
jgi:hypothetical protein